MSNEVIILILAGLISAIVTGVVLYIQGRKFEDAVAAALEKLLQDEKWLDTVEVELDESVPDELQNLILALLEVAERLVDGTDTDIDDRLVELLKKIMDGEPNA